jgi:hypothetical protein
MVFQVKHILSPPYKLHKTTAMKIMC